MIRWLAFGRKQYDEPLALLGDIDASPADAVSVCRERYGSNWVELSLIRGSEVHWVLCPTESKEQLVGKLSSWTR